jgi:hypothetical protein
MSLPSSSAVRASALGLAVDSVTAEVVKALNDARIRSLLLKGPSFAGWLYEDGARPYGDSDLLVSPGSYGRAGQVLSQLGFRPLGYMRHDSDSEPWVRHSDSAWVDLHRSLIGAEAPSETVWVELAAGAATLPVGGIEVEVLGEPARALHVGLHAAQHGVDEEPPLEDLRRAIRTVDVDTWRKAVEIARRVDALPAFAAGLRLEPAGERLAEKLKLPADRSPLVALRSGPHVPLAVTLERLAGEASLLARTRLLLAALLPSPGYMRRWAPGRVPFWDDVRRHRRVGLCLAYAWRPIWFVLRLPGAIAAVGRARRGQR